MIHQERTSEYQDGKAYYIIAVEHCVSVEETRVRLPHDEKKLGGY